MKDPEKLYLARDKYILAGDISTLNQKFEALMHNILGLKSHVELRIILGVLLH